MSLLCSLNAALFAVHSASTNRFLRFTTAVIGNKVGLCNCMLKIVLKKLVKNIRYSMWIWCWCAIKLDSYLFDPVLEMVEHYDCSWKANSILMASSTIFFIVIAFWFDLNTVLLFKLCTPVCVCMYVFQKKRLFFRRVIVCKKYSFV